MFVYHVFFVDTVVVTVACLTHHWQGFGNNSCLYVKVEDLHVLRQKIKGKISDGELPENKSEETEYCVRE